MALLSASYPMQDCRKHRCFQETSHAGQLHAADVHHMCSAPFKDNCRAFAVPVQLLQLVRRLHEDASKRGPSPGGR